MSVINMDLVKELREKTQVGMMDCKKALVEANGDMEKAVEILRKKGAAVAAKRSGNATDNGRIESFISADNKSGALVSIACETDFSANTEAMKEFALLVAKEAASMQTIDVIEFLSEKRNVKDNLDELIAKITEKIEVSRIVAMRIEGNGIIASYIHPGSTIGVIVMLVASNDVSSIMGDLKALARDICMHIAVTNPMALGPQDLDPALIAKEREIAMEQMQKTNKPADIMAKIIDGKMSKFCAEVCLTQQRFIKNEDITIEQLVQNFSKQHKNDISINSFARLSIGR